MIKNLGSIAVATAAALLVIVPVASQGQDKAGKGKAKAEAKANPDVKHAPVPRAADGKPYLSGTLAKRRCQHQRRSRCTSFESATAHRQPPNPSRAARLQTSLKAKRASRCRARRSDALLFAPRRAAHFHHADALEIV